MNSKSGSLSALVHPHDEGLPQSVILKRKRFRLIGYLMLLIAVLSAAPGWFIYGVSVVNASSVGGNRGDITAIIGYGLLILSSITLVLGLWYLLLAQVRRLARMVEGGGDAGQDRVESSRPICLNCGWPRDPPDRFCRHCGKPLVELNPGIIITGGS